MNIIVPPKRKDGKSSFNKLVSYVVLRDDKKLDETLSPDMPFVRPSRSSEAVFDRLVAYIRRTTDATGQTIIQELDDGRQRVLFENVACETNCFSIETAAAEMNMVAEQNVRKKDPVYHFILSWRTEDAPLDSDVFDATRYCIEQIGMGEHQYVSAIHRDTDNVHCHVAVNRVHPVTLMMADKYYALDTIQKCCREMEHKYNWKPDNGTWVRRADDGKIVRVKRDWQPAPRGARQIEHHADRESLYTYAVDRCRNDLDAVLSHPDISWREVHSVLVRAGLELKRKGEGLAVYPQPKDGETETSQRPIKASRLHPRLTLSHIEPMAGEFQPSPPAQRWSPDRLVYSQIIESDYDVRLHVRSRGNREEKRIARAERREDLIARYHAYKKAWVKPCIPPEEVKRRYKEMAQGFQARKARVRITERDPLLRKLMYRAIEVERMVATAELRTELRAERDAIKMNPDNQRLTYRQWVEVQATLHDQAAIDQLRGWAHRQQRNAKTAVLARSGFLCGAADETRSVGLKGYQTRVHRDGVVVYSRDGEDRVLDRGNRIEVVPGDRKNIGAAVVVAAKKNADVLEVRGDTAFINDTLGVMKQFNEPRAVKLAFTNPEQQKWLDKPAAGRPTAAVKPASSAPVHRPQKSEPPKPKN
ncbi:mobilization protein MobA [Salmonella enterica subsp. enterica serovar Saintpaul]|nr:mobilization protein MobA [Salmonella enterica subsp. enterica serovar Saintpaul]